MASRANNHKPMPKKQKGGVGPMMHKQKKPTRKGMHHKSMKTN